MQLSDRLNAVLDLVNPTSCVADIGCDHGFVSIELINRGIAEHVIAMDVVDGPLNRAKEHVAQYGLEERIETRLSDGVEGLGYEETQAVIIAGMGGNLVIHILSEGMNKISLMEQCILQPQSEIEKVRIFLRENKFKIASENMILEDGKFYPMMQVVPGAYETKEHKRIYDCYGELLLREKNPVLKKFLLRKLQKNNDILLRLQRENNCRHFDRIAELLEEKKLIEEALSFWKE